VTTLLSTGPAGGNGSTDALFRSSSADGSRAFFTTTESLVAGDTDNFADVYERADADTTLLSIGPSGGNASFGATYGGAADDGTKVFFATEEQLTPDDGDAFGDVYSSSVVPGYPRPRGATPVTVPLVIAYSECLAPNRSHGPPDLPGGSDPDASCAPPVQTSSQLTVGTPDSNSRGSNFTGSVRLSVVLGDPAPPDDADVLLTASLSDVRRKSNLSDYPGEVKATVSVRITDKDSVGGPNATVQDLPISFTFPCMTTPSTTVGSNCTASTTGDAVTMGGVKETKRSIWELGQVQVFDGGPDDDADTNPNTLFAVEGVFAP
jgi:hypothetical protein